MSLARQSSPKVRLLVVDDEPAHMTALHHTLAHAGYDVTAFPLAAPALQSLREQSFDLVQVSLGGIVREVVEELQKQESPRQVNVCIDDLADAAGDPVLLRQVLLNLLSNSFKFTRNTERPEVTVDCQEQEQETIYRVRDNGAGFDMCLAGSLFNVFHRFHSATEFEGTSVGLSLVQRIVHRHGGRIWAEAAVNQGATFYFSLPRFEGPPLPSTPTNGE